MTNNFKVVDDSTVAEWTQLLYPIMDSTTWDISDTYYYISVGLFTYDTTLMQTYAPTQYSEYF